MKRKCIHCGLILDLIEFHNNSLGKHGKQFIKPKHDKVLEEMRKF